jgi:hypothetical protein
MEEYLLKKQEEESQLFSYKNKKLLEEVKKIDQRILKENNENIKIQEKGNHHESKIFD